jgi:hypothetical protein
LLIDIDDSFLIAERVAQTLLSTPSLVFKKELDTTIALIKEVIDDDIDKEIELENEVDDILDTYEETLENEFVDEYEVFLMLKKRLAIEKEFPLSYRERLEILSHRILNVLVYNDYIEFQPSNVLIKSKIYNAIDKFLQDKKKR